MSGFAIKKNMGLILVVLIMTVISKCSSVSSFGKDRNYLHDDNTLALRMKELEKERERVCEWKGGFSKEEMRVGRDKKVVKLSFDLWFVQ